MRTPDLRHPRPEELGRTDLLVVLSDPSAEIERMTLPGRPDRYAIDEAVRRAWPDAQFWVCYARFGRNRYYLYGRQPR